ncbi:hypothetical protein V8D89_006262 [Ganoderma adspersum]
MPSKRVTRASTRAARATAANPPIAPLNIPTPAPVPVVVNVPQAGAANGASPRRTRSGKILGIVRSVATKLTRPRRAPSKAVPIQEVAREVAETIDVVPTTNPATVPQPPAPPRKRGGKAVKKDENEVQAATNDVVAPAPIPAPSERTIERTKSTRSLTSKDKGKARELPIEDDEAPQPTVDPVPDPVPTAPLSPRARKTVEDIERVTQKLRALNATELANDKIQLEDLKWESCIHDNSNLKYHNIPKAAASLYRQRRAQPRPSARSMPAPPNQATARVGAPVQGRAGDHPHPQPQPRPQPQPPVASTSRGAGPSNQGPGPAPLKCEGGVNWGHPEYYKDRIQKAKEERRSLDPIDLDYPAPGELPVASTSTSSAVPSASATVPSASSTVPLASSTVPSASSTVLRAPSTVPPVSSTVPSVPSTVLPESSTAPLVSTTIPSPSTSCPPTANSAAPSGNRNAPAAVASDEPLPLPRIQRRNAVIFGYPQGYTPRNPWPASMIDPTGISTYPDAVRDASGAFVRPNRLSASVARPATSAAPPQPPATIPVPPTPAPVSRSPPVSTSSNESADLAEVEASISIDVDDGDAHPAADLLPPTAPSASSSNTPTVAAAPRPRNVTCTHASSFDERGRDLPRRRDDDEEAVVQQIVADVVREVEAERAARPPQQPTSRGQSTRTAAPPAPTRTATSTSRGPTIVWTEDKPGRSSGMNIFGLPPAPKTTASTSRGPAIVWPEDKPGASSGMNIFGPPTNAKGKGKAAANTASIFDRPDAKGKGRAVPTTIFGPPPVKGKAVAVQKENGRPPTSIFGTPSDNKDKKRTREPEPERNPEPAVSLYGYVSSTGPMKVRLSLVPAVPSPKRQRVSEAGGDTETAPADPAPADPAPADPVAPAAGDTLDESAPAPSEDPALQGSTQNCDGAAKRSRTEFEEGSSRADADVQDESHETRPAKKPRTGSQ